MANLLEFSNEKLQKLSNINRLLAISALIWLGILTVDVVFSGYILARENLLNSVLFYLFPITLYVIVFLTFYSSHGILENRNYKSLVLFILVQVVGWILYKEFNLVVPTYIVANKIASIFVIALLFVSLSAVLFLLVKDKDNAKLFEQIREQDIDESISQLKSLTYGKSHSNLGMIISAIFSTLVITLVSIRTFDYDLRYIVSSGVLIGVLAVALISRKEQTVLAILSLLDPEGAKYLFALKSVRDKSEFELEKLKDESDVQIMKTNIIEQRIQLGQDFYKARLQSLIAEMESLKNEEMFNIVETDLKEKIDNFKNMSPREKFVFLTSFEENINKLKAQELLGLEAPVINYDDLSLEEKMANLIGLSEPEILEAIQDGHIKTDQSFIWNLANQHKIKSAVADFENEQFSQEGVIFVATSLTKYMAPSNFGFKATLDLINKGNVSFSIIKGLEFLNLVEFRVITPIREYSAIVRLGPSQEFLIHAIVPTT